MEHIENQWAVLQKVCAMTQFGFSRSIQKKDRLVFDFVSSDPSDGVLEKATTMAA